MIYKLVQKAGNQTLELPIDRTVTVGRSITCDFVIDESTMSRVHAELSPVEGGVMLKDLGSSNGTFLHGSRIGMAIVMPGDRVGFGEAEFTLVEEEVEAPPEPIVTDAPEIAETIAVESSPTPEPAEPPEPKIPDVEPLSFASADREEPPAEIPEPDTDNERPAPGELRFYKTRKIEEFDPYEFFSNATDDASVNSFLNLKAESSWKRSIEGLCLLLKFSKDFSAAQQMEALLDHIVERIFASMDVDRAGIWLHGAGAPDLRKFRSTLEGPDLEFDIPQPILDKVFSDRVAVAANQTDRHSNNHTTLCAPLLGREGDILGVLYVDSLASSDSFGEQDLGFLITFADVAVAAIQNLIDRQQPREETPFAEVLPEETPPEEALPEETTSSNLLLRHFPPDLAERIAATEISLASTSYQAAVLAATVANSAELADDLQAADFAVLLQQIRDTVKDLVFRHHGILLQAAGDEFVAAWGIPLTAPDAADRAIAAGMEILDAVALISLPGTGTENESPKIGIGIDFGEMIAGNLGDAVDIDYVAVGDAVKEAVRLGAEAGPGGMAISQACLNALHTPPEIGPLRPAYRVKR